MVEVYSEGHLEMICIVQGERKRFKQIKVAPGKGSGPGRGGMALIRVLAVPPLDKSGFEGLYTLEAFPIGVFSRFCAQQCEYP